MKIKSIKYKGDMGKFFSVAIWDKELEDFVATVKLNIWGTKTTDVCDFEGRVFEMDRKTWVSLRDKGFGVTTDVELERMAHEVLDPNYIGNPRNIEAVVKSLNDVFSQVDLLQERRKN